MNGSRPSAEEALVDEVLEDLQFDEAEVYWKRGRTRTLHLTAGRYANSLDREEGWAVRAGDSRRSFFYAATGSPRPDTPWPEADGMGLRLSSPRPVPAWSAPSELDAPLMGENEAQAFLEGVGRALGEELPDARISGARLEDGSSEAFLASSRGVRGGVRRRAAALRLEAYAGNAWAQIEVTARDARRFSPKALAHRLADRLLVAQRGNCPPRDRGEFLFAPTVAARLMAGLAPLWAGPRAEKLAASLAERGGRLGSPVLSVVDDGRLSGGLFEAPIDGEGQPTREVVLVEKGTFRQPLLAWWQAGSQRERASGCVLRAGWRDLPVPGPTHLFVRPDLAVPATALIGDVERGYYLLDLEGAPRIDLENDRFALPVCGFALDGGRSSGMIAGAWVVGSIGAFLRGVVAVARDLTFHPTAAGLVGSPSLLVRGLELRRQS